MTTVAKAGVQGISYDDQGQGDVALLLFTGWCSSRQRWSLAAPLLAERHRVVSLDWRGHGDSSQPDGDFGHEDMVEDAVAVVEAARLDRFIPCAASHSGWVAIELRRRMPDRIPALVHLDWMVLEPPERYMAVIDQLCSTREWSQARDTLFGIWKAGVELPPIDQAIEAMSAHGADMWMRSGREIGGAYRHAGSPLQAWSRLDPLAPVIHIYGQPPAEEFLAAQERFAAEHDWFRVKRVPAMSHFSMIEAPQETVAAIEGFVAAHVG